MKTGRIVTPFKGRGLTFLIVQEACTVFPNAVEGTEVRNIYIPGVVPSQERPSVGFMFQTFRLGMLHDVQ